MPVTRAKPREGSQSASLIRISCWRFWETTDTASTASMMRYLLTIQMILPGRKLEHQFEPGMHFGNDDSNNLNKFYVHWDRRSSAFRESSDQYLTSWNEMYDAASTHQN